MVSNFEFHCHSQYSGDSNVKIDDLIKRCQKVGITGLALTDHNEISGALELRKKAPNWLKIIVGEEVNTASGEIIGLFLSQKIPSGLSIEETIYEIKKQGGIVILPHPFDRLRSNKMPLTEIFRNINNFDVIETFNARSVFFSDNTRARDYVKTHHKLSICGSDAHFLAEYGQTTIKNIDCSGPQEFLSSLKNAVFKTKRASLIFHLLTKYEKLKTLLTQVY